MVVPGLTAVNRYRVRYRVCEGGMERMGVVLATDWNKACEIALKSYPIVVEVMDGPPAKMAISDSREPIWMRDKWLWSGGK